MLITVPQFTLLSSREQCIFMVPTSTPFFLIHGKYPFSSRFHLSDTQFISEINQKGELPCQIGGNCIHIYSILYCAGWTYERTFGLAFANILV